ncbi:MAG: acylneuraminate cytidylyltransferase family protein [Chloroflexi bacterium]|nr:acylneuraminate cytidylyltransferase family protein [Chloroflexota bacterium]
MSEKRPNILGVIPARGGSKSVPRKNLALLNGKPMLCYTIEAARQSKMLTHFVVSSEDEEIIKVAKSFGAPAPFVRPAELATDEAPSLPVVQHALREVEKKEGITFEYVVLLQATSPLRNAADIDAALKKLLETGADSVVSVVRVAHHHPARMRFIEDDLLVQLPMGERKEMQRRQDLPPVYIRNGAIFATRRHVVMEQNSMLGRISRPYVMPESRSANVDTRFDFLVVEVMIQHPEKVEE